MRRIAVCTAVMIGVAVLAPPALGGTKPDNRATVYNDGGKIYGSTLVQNFTALDVPSRKTVILTKAKTCDETWVQFKQTGKKGDFSFERSYNTENFPSKMEFRFVITSPGFKKKVLENAYTLLGEQYAGC